MRQFEVYENPYPQSRAIAGLIVVIQSHFLTSLPSVLVAPLLRRPERPAYSEVSVEIEFEGEAYVVSLAELAVMDRQRLQRVVGDLREYEDAIRRALDRVFTGF